MPPSVFKVEASTMERFLRRLDEPFGGPREWALGAGITEDQLNSLTRLLLEEP